MDTLGPNTDEATCISTELPYFIYTNTYCFAGIHRPGTRAYIKLLGTCVIRHREHVKKNIQAHIWKKKNIRALKSSEKNIQAQTKIPAPPPIIKWSLPYLTQVTALQQI